MSNRQRAWYIIGMLCFLVAVEASAQVPQLITYQGRLTESNGIPFSGSHTMVFRVYDAETGGNKLWEESHAVTLAKEDNGIFSVVLGSLSSLSNLDFNQSLWLALAVDGEGDMSPRQRFTAVGYAINADTLDGLDSTEFVRVDGEGDVIVAGSLTVSGTLSGSSVTSGTLTSVDSGAGLTGGPITSSGTLAVGAGSGIAVNADDVAVKLNSSGPGLVADADGVSLLRTCADGQLLKWTASTSSWGCAADTDTDTNSGGTVTSVTAGTGLSGGTIIGSGTISLDAPVSVAHGGTGASTASGARANLINCLPIGSSDGEDQNNDFELVWPVPVAGSLSQFR
ncbi:MAG: hypothetical protein HY595_01250, partial [Candidatus Omnitrophica bacterium]|nr:hypothetical protein [Candidatus Omnitrophota bacterium]